MVYSFRHMIWCFHFEIHCQAEKTSDILACCKYQKYLDIMISWPVAYVFSLWPLPLRLKSLQHFSFSIHCFRRFSFIDIIKGEPSKKCFFWKVFPNIGGLGGWFPNKVQNPKSPRKSPFLTRISPFSQISQKPWSGWMGGFTHLWKLSKKTFFWRLPVYVIYLSLYCVELDHQILFWHDNGDDLGTLHDWNILWFL